MKNIVFYFLNLHVSNHWLNIFCISKIFLTFWIGVQKLSMFNMYNIYKTFGLLMSSRYLQWSPSNFSFYSFSLLTIWCRLCLVGIGVHFVYSIWFVQLWMFCNLCFCIECSYCSSHRTQQLNRCHMTQKHFCS